MSLHGKYSTQATVKQQLLFSALLQQGVNLSILKLIDLLLPLIDQGGEGSDQDVPLLEDRGHIDRPNRPVFGAD